MAYLQYIEFYCPPALMRCKFLRNSQLVLRIADPAAPQGRRQKLPPVAKRRTLVKQARQAERHA